jgi:hypothetical protein
MAKNFHFSRSTRPALKPNQPPMKWVKWAFSLELKRQGRGADHSPPTSAEVKNTWVCISTPPLCLYVVVLDFKHRDNIIHYGWVYHRVFLDVVVINLCSDKHWYINTSLNKEADKSEYGDTMEIIFYSFDHRLHTTLPSEQLFGANSCRCIVI